MLNSAAALPAKIQTVLKRRCAVYTRKSSEEGLEQEFNSLHAQREACEAYVASQRPEGWVLAPDHYDDGGVSGGTLQRPGLQRLLGDIASGLVDVVVVYKIDRLTRALMDFSRLVEIFDRHDVSFVSVTQSFNTTSSMGRLTLNILLSFAQFEREVTAERIRDKFASSRARGMWMGGHVPLGYDVVDRKLVVNDEEAATVRAIFAGMARTRSATLLVKQLQDEGMTAKHGRPISKGYVYKLLNNQLYIGKAMHKGKAWPGAHEPIIDQALWDKVHAVLRESPRKRAGHTRGRTPALLKGIIFGPDGAVMTPTYTRKRGRLYRYYVTRARKEDSHSTCPVGRIPAGEIEAAVIDQLRKLVLAPEIVIATWRAVRNDLPDMTESDVRCHLEQLGSLWSELFPAEQARIVHLLIERIDVSEQGAAIRLRIDGLTTLLGELTVQAPADSEAA